MTHTVPPDNRENRKSCCRSTTNLPHTNHQTQQSSNSMMKGTIRSNKIAVAVSGGVDSSVAAYLLKQSFEKNINSSSNTNKNRNRNIFGLHMSNWKSSDEESEGNYCEQSEKDARDARDVCDRLGIEMYRAEFVSEYWTGVFEPFVKALVDVNVDGFDEEGQGQQQRMVNPDIGCNRVVKFGAMRDYAMKRGAKYVATGHYARLWHRNRSLYSFNSSTTTNSNDDERALYELMRSHNEEQDIETERLVQEHITGLPEEEWICQWGKINEHEHGSTAPLLLSGADLSKDQSYFLSGVIGSALSNAIFPLGDLMKKNLTTETTNILAEGTQSKINQNIESQESGYMYDFNGEKYDDLKFMSVRDIAEKAGLPTATKKESMGICFVGKRKFAEFITQYLPHQPEPGNFIDVDTGEIVGKHNGSAHFTVGQGAKISGASQKWFICKKGRNGTVFVCNSTHHPSLYSNELFVRIDDFNWMVGQLPPPLLEQKSMLALCRTRHLQPLVPCIVSLTKNESHIAINFDRPVRAITPGQTAALYVGKGLICLGGGQIWMHGPTYHDLDITLPPLLHPAGSNDLSVQYRLREN